MEIEEIEVDKLKEVPAYKELMPPPSMEDYQALKDSINKHGIKISLTVNKDYEIIDGYSRFKIAKELGLNTVPCTTLMFKNRFEEQEYVILSNLHRRHLTNAQKAEIGLKLLEIEEEKARKRQLSKLKHVGDAIVPLESEERGEAMEIVAERVGVGKDTIWKARKIKEKTENDERIRIFWDEAKKGKRTINSVYKLIEHEEKIKKLEEKIKSLPEPEGKYHVIVIDPPWQYGTKYNPDGRRVASPYPEINTQELEKIELPADDDCILWLWATNAFLHDAFHLMEKWGFEYKTMLTWVKDKIGVGSWLRGQTEHCLLGVKGKPILNLINQSTVLFASNKGHSKKPDEFYEMVDKLCIGKKLDYFGTKKRKGWSIHGTV